MRLESLMSLLITMSLAGATACGDDGSTGGHGGGGASGAAGGGGASAGGASAGGSGQGGNPLQDGQCRNPEDCGGGFSCTPPGSFFCGGAVMCTFDPVCTGDGDCGDMKICEPDPCCTDSTCRPGCYSNNDCLPGGQCGADLRCTAMPCPQGDECGPNATCSAGQCTQKTCTSDADCDDYCVGGSCYAGPGTCDEQVP